MLDINEVHKEIEKLENCDCTTWDVCKRLAILYIVRDHYKENAAAVRTAGTPNQMNTMAAAAPNKI